MGKATSPYLNLPIRELHEVLAQETGTGHQDDKAFDEAWAMAQQDRVKQGTIEEDGQFNSLGHRRAFTPSDNED